MRGCAWIYALFSREDMQTGWGQGGDRAQGADGNMKAERADQQVSNKGKKGRGNYSGKQGRFFLPTLLQGVRAAKKDGRLFFKSDKKARMDFFELTDLS